jgi:hypothetical protein
MEGLGSKLVRNTAIGAGVGAAVGAGVGAWKVSQEIEKVPTDTVTLGGYDRPVMQKVNLGTETRISADSNSPYWGSGVYSHDVVVDSPVKNPDGSIKMEHVAPQTVTDHGKAIVGTESVTIKEPVNVRKETVTEIGHTHADGYYDKNNNYVEGPERPYVDVNTYVRYNWNNVGNYTKPTVEFEHGVNTAGIVLTNMAIFAGIGGAIAAAATVVMDRVK